MAMKQATLIPFSRIFLILFLLLQNSIVSSNARKGGRSPAFTATNTKSVYRGKVFGPDDELSEESLYQAYQEVLEDYKAKLETGPWRVLKERKHKGIEVAVCSSPQDRICPYVRMTATMPTTAKDLHQFMKFSNWDKFMHLLNPFYDSMDILKSYRHGEAELTLARKQTTRVFGFGRRDFGLVSVLDTPKEDGMLVSGTFSIISPQVPRHPGFTRAFQDSICFYEPLGNECRMTILCRTDLNDSAQDGRGGHIPMWLIVRTMGLAGSRALRSLQRLLESQQPGNSL